MRRSSMQSGAPAGVPDAEPAPTRAAEYLGYAPTTGQRLVKAQFWAAWADDPSADPASVTPAYIAQRVDAPSIDKWWRQPGFREWFCNQEEWRARAEAAVNMWLDESIKRLSAGSMLATKDLVALGKVLTEVADKLPRHRAAPVTPPGGKKLELTEAEARALFEKMALAAGWTPPSQVTDGTK